MELVSKSEKIIESITQAIETGELIPGQAIPSINSAAKTFGVARKTVVRAYEKLKMRGLIESRAKTGFFVINRKPSERLKILLIVHSFDGHWETLYNSFRTLVSTNCEIEICFHHYNIKVLELLINRNVGDYDLFIISSFNHPRIKNIVGRIPAYKVLIISRNDRLENRYNSITQDFYFGTFSALKEATNQIKKYKKLVLSFPEKSGHPQAIIKGFQKYCQQYAVPFRVVNSINDFELKKGYAFLIIDDNDLIEMLTICKIRNWQPGVDIGLITYNETPLKQFIYNGITVISCNFKSMAFEMSEFINRRKSIQKTIPISLIKRQSL